MRDLDPAAGQARRGLLIYFAVLVVGTVVLDGCLIRAGDSIRNHVALVLPLMWMPAIASCVARLALREGVQDVSFRFGGKAGLREASIAWLFPVGVGLIAYGIAWASGLTAFRAMRYDGSVVDRSPAVAVITLLGVRMTIGVVISAIATTGEELGWRGYMLTRLIVAGVPRPVLVSGLIWAAWHLPLIFGGVYAASSDRWLSAACFGIAITAQAFVCARVRLASGSVWPAVVAHSAWNAVIQGVFDFSSVAEPSANWVGESGVLVAAASAGLALLCAHGPRPMQRAPGIPLVA